MIAYEELDRALARWKARTHGGAAADPAPALEAEPLTPDVEAMSVEDEPGAMPVSPPAGLPRPSSETGEINLEEEVIETYDEDR